MFKQRMLTIAWLLTATGVQGSDQIPGAPQTKPIAIAGATLHTVSGQRIAQGTIVFDKGKITRIGAHVPIEDSMEVIEASGKHVYPSLIEAKSDLGLVEINTVRGSIDSREVGSMNPNVRAAVAFNPDSELIPVNRSNGILLAVTAPSGGLIAGRSALMMLDGWTWEDMILQSDVGMHLRWPSNKDSLKELEQIFDQANRYMRARQAGNESEQPRDLRLESLATVLQGDLPLIVDASSIAEISSAVAFARRHSLRIIIYGGTEAEQCAELLRAENVPVIVSGVYRNPSHRHAAYDEAYTLPKRLAVAGVQFCISAGGRFGASGVRNLPYNAATAAAYGLPESQALRAITLSAAEILNVHDRVGALQVGLDATLFIASGDILETPTQVEVAFVQGRKVDLSNKQTQLNHKYSTKYAR